MSRSSSPVLSRIGRRLGLREHPWFWLAFALLVLPLLYWFSARLAEGWIPQGDEALTAIRAHDAWSGHWPLVGMRSTSDQTVEGVYAYHPGPLEFYVIGLPYLLSGWQVWGLVLGCVIVTAAFVGVALWSGYRAAGIAGLLMVAGITVTLYGLFDSVLVLPWNPWPTVFGLLASLTVGWRMLIGQRGQWPLFLVCVSYTGQAHLGITPIVGLLGVWMLALSLRRWWHGWPVDRRQIKRSIGVALLCWFGPIIDLFTYSPSNISEVLAMATADKAEDTSGDQAWTHVTHMIFPWVRWWRDKGDDGAVTPVGAAIVVVACAIVIGVVVARRRQVRRALRTGVPPARDADRHAATAAVWIGLFAAGATFWAGTRTGGGLRIVYLDFSMAGPLFLSFAVAMWLFVALRGVLEDLEIDADRLRSLRRRAVVAALVVPVLGTLQDPSYFRQFYAQGQDKDVEQAKHVLEEVVPLLERPEYANLPVLVEGAGFTAWGSIAPALSSRLVADGRDVFFDSWWEKKADDEFRRPENVAGERVVVRFEERAADETWKTPAPDVAEEREFRFLAEPEGGRIRALIAVRDE